MDHILRSEHPKSRLWLALIFLPVFTYVLCESLYTHLRAAFGWVRCDLRQAYASFKVQWR